MSHNQTIINTDPDTVWSVLSDGTRGRATAMTSRGPQLPRPRGPLSEALIATLTGESHTLGAISDDVDPRVDDDFQLALHVAYELHYRSFDGVDDGWEWHPAVLSFTRALERRFETALRDDITLGPCASADIVAELPALLDRADGPSLSSYVLTEGTLHELREFAIHRSAYQLKEADPHTWAIPRLTGEAKAALVRMQNDEYGNGVANAMHSTLFADTMVALGLDPTYGAYVDQLPGATLATGNLVTMFGLHRRLRGALVGHLAGFEMTSVVPMTRYSRALRRLGVARRGRHFYDVHVEADAVHEQVALHDMVGMFVRDEPEMTNEVLFGAQALMDVESRFASALLSAWQHGRTSLLTAEPEGFADIA